MQATIPAIRFRISYGFWIVALLPGLSGGLRGMAVWGAIVFGSVVLHELGHALTGLSAGRRAVIVLHQLGGRTEFEPRLPARRATWSMWTGPVLSLLVGAGLFLARRAITPAPNWLSIAMWVNLGWGALNILPIIPFTGGRLLMDRVGKERPATALLICSATTALVSTLGVVTIRHTGFAVLFLSIILLSLFELAKANEKQVRTTHVADPYTVATVQREAGRFDQAIQTLERAPKGPTFRREAARLLIDLYAEGGDLERAFSTTLEHLRLLGPEDAQLVVRALEQAEDFRHAAQLSHAIGAPSDPIS